MKNTFTYFPHERMYHIHLGVEEQLGVAIVCQEGFDIASSYSGTWTKDGGGHAVIKFKNTTHTLARVLIKAPWNYDVDHKNGNPLDNRIDNLQLITEQHNIAKGKMWNSNTSGYRGVCYIKETRKWLARVKVNKKQIHLGCHLTKEDAALAYNIAAKQYFGEFAFQNIIKPNDTTNIDKR